MSKKVKILFLGILIFILNNNFVFARGFYDERIKLTKHLDLVVSIEAELKDGLLVDANNAKLYVDGISGFLIESQNVKLEPYNNTYKAKYNAYLLAEINDFTKREFPMCFFEKNNKIRKYIEGEIIMSVPNSNICVFEQD